MLEVKMNNLRLYDPSTRQFATKPVKLALAAVFATFMVIWTSGWLAFDNIEAPGATYVKSVERVERVMKSYSGSNPSWWNSQRRIRPSTGAVTPFSTFNCLGDEHAEALIYNRPFRFHVYADMPDDLYSQIVEKALTYWKPDHSNNQFETEARLLEDLTLHPCHTTEPTEADAFIVPIQTISTIWLQKEAGVKDGGRAMFAKVMKWLEGKPAYVRSNGRDHYAMGIAWDKTRRPFGEMNLFGPETPTNFSTIKDFDSNGYVHGLHDIVIPYPDADAVEYYTEERRASIERSKLAIFVGSMIKQTPVRERIAKQMGDYNERKGAELAVWKYIDHNTDTQALKDLLPTAIFGPVMEGDSLSSRRLFSLIFAGTVPVVVCDRLMLPYEDMLEYSAFVVFISEQDVLKIPDFNLLELLDSIPKQDVKLLQENGKKVRKHFTYHKGDVVPGDAFDMFVRSLALVNFNGRRLRNMIKRASDSSAVDLGSAS